MINSNLRNNSICNGSTATEIDKRLDIIEEQIRNSTKTFSSDKISANELSANSSSLGKANASSLDTVSVKAKSINVDNLDVSGPISFRDVDITENLDVRNERVDTLSATDISAADVKTRAATIDTLTVGQIKSQDGNTLVNDITVAGTANVNKLRLGDPHVDSIDAKVIKTVTANVTNAQITNIDAVDNEHVREIALEQRVIRGDGVNTNMIGITSPTAMQVGDADNQVILRCDSRPLWNDKVIATLDDLGDKIVPAYKGRIPTEQELPTTGTIGDYYIITMLTKGSKSGIGFALYNGTQFDTDFFYELEGYRLAADQDMVDDAQDTAIANEIVRAKGKEDDLYANGTKRLIEKNINTIEMPELDKMFGDEYFGRAYTGTAPEWKGLSTLPIGAEAAGFCLEILSNKHNTIQRYSINTTHGPRIWLRNYGNKTWSEWREVAFVEDILNLTEQFKKDNMLKLRQTFFDDAHPVKDTFVSNDGADDPNKIYNVNGITSTWNYVGQSFGIHGWRRVK